MVCLHLIYLKYIFLSVCLFVCLFVCYVCMYVCRWLRSPAGRPFDVHLLSSKASTLKNTSPNFDYYIWTVYIHTYIQEEALFAIVTCCFFFCFVSIATYKRCYGFPSSKSLNFSLLFRYSFKLILEFHSSPIFLGQGCNPSLYLYSTVLIMTKQLKFTTTSRQCLASPSKLRWWVRLRDVRVAVDCDIYNIYHYQ